jgi:uncharacterized membrane protein
VFAIVVTLLVLELSIPAVDEPLWPALVREWPAVLGYFVSFAFIGGSWIAHNDATRFLKSADAMLLRLNLLLLLFVSFLPFTTSLVASRLGTSGEDLAVVLFGADLTLAASMVNLLVRYAAHDARLAADDVAAGELRAFERERRLALLLLAAATVVGAFFAVVAVVVFLAISVLLLAEPLWRSWRIRVVRGRARTQPRE